VAAFSPQVFRYLQGQAYLQVLWNLPPQTVQTVAEKPMGGIKPMTKGQEIVTIVANEQIEVAATK